MELRFSRFAGLCTLLAAGPTYGLFAQTVKLVNHSYVESFVGNPKVSGNLLVGLLMGAPMGKFDPNAVGLLLSPDARGRKACVEVSSRDGRYFAQNLYQIPDGQGAALFETKTEYLQRLGQYDAEELAVTIRVVDDCNSAERGVVVPAALAAKRSPDAAHGNLGRSLVAYVNADKDRLQVSLLKNGTKLAVATCNSAANAVNISFTSSCGFQLTGDLDPGMYDLLIRLHERFDWSVSRFSVSIPPAR